MQYVHIEFKKDTQTHPCNLISLFAGNAARAEETFWRLYKFIHHVHTYPKPNVRMKYNVIAKASNKHEPHLLFWIVKYIMF